MLVSIENTPSALEIYSISRQKEVTYVLPTLVKLQQSPFSQHAKVTVMLSISGTNAYKTVEGYVHSFFTWTLGGGEWSASRCGHSAPRRVSSTH